MVLAGMVLAFLGLSCATALAAAPTVMEHGVTNPLAWGLASLKTTRVYASVDASGAWAIIDVLDHVGVRKVLYSGPAGAPRVRLYTAPWNGRDYKGVQLPTGNYKYRVRMSRGGITTNVGGALPVCRSRFTLVTDRDKKLPGYYLYSGLTRVYAQCDHTSLADLYVDVFTTSDLPDLVWTTGTQGIVLPASPTSARWTGSWKFTIPSTGRHDVDLGATSDPGAIDTYPPIAGLFTVTFMQ
jgi:hypothetical protein